MNNKLIRIRRAGLAALLLALSAVALTAAPSAAAATYSFDKTLATRTFDYQSTFTLQDLATARIDRVGITPIPIP